MHFLNTVIGSLVALGAQCISAGPVGTNDQIYPVLEYGTFQSPSTNVRPRFRYWPNDASVNLSRVAEDVRDAGKVGAGGVELLGYYLYGDSPAYGGGNADPLQSDWTVYGFGSPAWKNLLDTVLKVAQEDDLLIDFAVGPNQGAGVPSPYNDTGLLWDLAPFNVSVPAGGSFKDVLPGWGYGPLVAATTALLVDTQNTTTGETEFVLGSDSLTDITDQVGPSGKLSINFPSTAKGSEYLIFAFYLKHSEYREVYNQFDVQIAVPQSPIQNYKQNGSWVVDHFSAEGAQLTIDFWQQNLLFGDTPELIRQVGNYMWEDSQEYGAGVTIFWTPALSATFAKNRGYSINKYIPLLLGVAGTTTYFYVTDGEDAGASYVEDYEQTLTELNRIYLTTLTQWSERLGVQWSAQVVYNLPMDMLANIPYVNGPECETLGFAHNIDGYRQFAGPANLAGKRIISSEAGAVMYQAYQQTIPELLWDLKRSVAGSVNQYIIHGYPYSGNYGNTTWPGFTTFQYLFSEMHGRHQPAWAFYSDWLDWLSRTQYIAQSGAPKVDIAFYSKLTSYESVTTQYWPNDLLDAGYTYEYLSPDNFGLPEAFVSDGAFAPNRQNFKAMVIRGNDTLTPTGVNKIIEYAHQGLPIIFSGGIPSNVSGHNPSLASSASALLNNVTSLSNVHVVSYENLASTLSSLNILPRTAVASNGTWYTYWREDDETSTDFVYIYNDATGIPLGQGMSVGTITFETTDTPYLYDAWTGDEVLFPSYQQTSTHTDISLQLAGNQSIIIGFRKNANTTSNSTPHNNAILSAITGNTTNSSSKTLTLSNWTLTIESWTPPSNPYDLESPATKTNTTYFLPSGLVPWSSISSSLTNVSGLGYYTTTFTSPSFPSGGAFIDLGPILHTARLLVNGHTLPPLDPTWAIADVTQYLTHGENRVDVVVSTPLGNVLRNYWDETITSGKVATATVPEAPGEAEYGLVGTVRVVGY